jgi:hypothetical protein
MTGRCGQADNTNRMAVTGMYPTHEMVMQRQRALLSAAVQRGQMQRTRALSRATRRAERAERRLARSRREATRLRDELAAEVERFLQDAADVGQR